MPFSNSFFFILPQNFSLPHPTKELFLPSITFCQPTSHSTTGHHYLQSIICKGKFFFFFLRYIYIFFGDILGVVDDTWLFDCFLTRTPLQKYRHFFVFHLLDFVLLIIFYISLLLLLFFLLFIFFLFFIFIF
jgi:hypothetical protein